MNAPERFEKAFANIPKEVWKVFEHGHEIMDEVAKMKEERLAISKAHAEGRAGGGGAPPSHPPPTSVRPDAGHESLPQKLMDGFRGLLQK